MTFELRKSLEACLHTVVFTLRAFLHHDSITRTKLNTDIWSVCAVCSDVYLPHIGRVGVPCVIHPALWRLPPGTYIVNVKCWLCPCHSLTAIGRNLWHLCHSVTTERCLGLMFVQVRAGRMYWMRVWWFGTSPARFEFLQCSKKQQTASQGPASW